jgi:hypothetical protein
MRPLVSLGSSHDDARGEPCMRPATEGGTGCRLHGGAPGSGAPKGERNGRYTRGRFTAEAIEERRVLKQLLRSLC